MAEILTPEAVRRYRNDLLAAVYDSVALTEEVHALEDTLEALREQLTEAQADVRAAVGLFSQLDLSCLHCKQKLSNFLARPGVKRVLEDQHG